MQEKDELEKLKTEFKKLKKHITEQEFYISQFMCTVEKKSRVDTIINWITIIVCLIIVAFLKG